MTSNDEWVRERAIEAALDCGFTRHHDALIDAIAAFGHEAIERGKRMERDEMYGHPGGDREPERGRAEQDKAVASAVAAERERCEAECQTLRNIAINADDRANAAEAKLARLENPDEALVEVLKSRGFVSPDAWQGAYLEGALNEVCRVIHRALTEGKDDTP